MLNGIVTELNKTTMMITSDEKFKKLVYNSKHLRILGTMGTSGHLRRLPKFSDRA